MVMENVLIVVVIVKNIRVTPVLVKIRAVDIVMVIIGKSTAKQELSLVAVPISV